MLVSVSDFSLEALQNIINVPKIDASSEHHYLEEFNWSDYSMKYSKMPFFSISLRMKDSLSKSNYRYFKGEPKLSRDNTCTGIKYPYWCIPLTVIIK